MKALISPNEVFTHTWITSWKQENNPWMPNITKWVPDTTNSIENCLRVAEVKSDNEVFQVAQPLFWVACPDNCKADQWYYKDGQVQIKPQDLEEPQGG